MIEACEASLKRLNTDWIDVYQMNRCRNNVPIDATLRALDDLVRAGKIRYIGGSMLASWRIVESLWVAQELGLKRLVSASNPPTTCGIGPLNANSCQPYERSV